MADTGNTLWEDRRPPRVSIPLMMLEGNLEALLENTIPVNGISLKRHGANGVVLVVQMSDEQKVEARALGFSTVPIPND